MNHRITSHFFLVSLLFASLLAAGCSTPAPVLEEPSAPETEAEELRFPRWFAGDGEVVWDEQRVSAYATALGADSASAARKGAIHARLLLQSQISTRLESVRREAASGEGSVLDSPSFILSLRKAEQGLSAEGEAGRIRVEPVEGRAAWRSFAEVTVDRSRLLEQLERRLTGSGWEQMKQSAAFSEW